MAATMTAAIAATTVVALPALLVGGLAILVQRDLGLGDAELGGAIAASYAGAAVVAAPAGRMAERLGPKRTTWLGLGLGTASLLGIGLVADSWGLLALFLAIGGIGITTVQLGINVLLARSIPEGRRGLAFGAKQAAVPLASLLAGLALPAIGLTVGWQAAFVLAALFVPFVALRIPDASAGSRRETDGGVPPALNPLILLTVGVALASAGGNATPAFIVASAVDRGFAPGSAGLVLAGGSLVGILVRVAGGWVGDRIGRGSLLLVAGLVTVGAVGYVGLAISEHPLLVAAFTACAFGGGWGWGGLLLLALTRTNPDAPGHAMGIVQVGPMTGAVLGPLVFGVLAEQAGFAAAWSAMAALALGGVATILVSRRRLLQARGSHPSADGRTRLDGGRA